MYTVPMICVLLCETESTRYMSLLTALALQSIKGWNGQSFIHGMHGFPNIPPVTFTNLRLYHHLLLELPNTGDILLSLKLRVGIFSTIILKLPSLAKQPQNSLETNFGCI